jgi:hypothetical protein
VFGAQAISPYQQIIEKTKNLSMRANAIAISIDKKIKNVEQQVISFLKSILNSKYTFS